MKNSKISSMMYFRIREIILEARSVVTGTVNYVTIIQNWEIGRMIVEEEQKGKARAEYGKNIITELSKKLTDEFGSSYDERNLRYYRKFYQTFPIRNAVSSKLKIAEKKTTEKRNAVSSESEGLNFKGDETREDNSPELTKSEYTMRLTTSHPLFQIISPFLSWTHYRILLKVENQRAREFYIKEAVANGWGTRALARQINSLYYERLLSSKEKQPLVDEMKEKTKTLNPEDILKDPYVLEFLQLKDNKSYRETELEQALIDRMSEFLLELGKGFAFVARQKHISTETKNFYIDLVFYNYLLKCFVLIDLKTGELTHQDIGQMDMYVRLYEDKYKSGDDNPTIGIILSTQKDETIVKYSILNESKQLFASKYMLYLPSEEEIRKEIEYQKHQFKIENNL
jgi:predicted nuclease of restriction endonuclease-like (RecB) superfamily